MGTEMDTRRQDRERDFFDRLAREWGQLFWGAQTPAGIARMKRRVGMLCRHLRDLESPRVLELGCGVGAFSIHIPDACPGIRLVACDLSMSALQVAKGRESRPVFVASDTTALPHPPRCFDAVVGNSILHHVPIRATLAACLHVLKPGGLLWFSEPNMLNPQIALEKNVKWIGKRVQKSPDETAFFRWQIAAALNEAGFHDIRVRPFDFLHPLVPKSCIRWVGRLGEAAERVPVLREIAGSLLIEARAPALCQVVSVPGLGVGGWGLRVEG